MYDSRTIAERISSYALGTGVPVQAMLRDCDLGKNTLTNMRSGRSLACDSLALIADRLSCSVDFLLGRTDVVEVGAMPEGAVVLSDDELLLLERYRSLSGNGREMVRSEALRQLQLENLNRGTGEEAASAG